MESTGAQPWGQLEETSVSGWPTRAEETGLGDQATSAEPDDRELAPGHQFVGESPGDPEHLARLGHGVDEALFGCLECAVSGCHGRHCRVWTSTAMSTKVSTPADFEIFLLRNSQGSPGRRSRGADMSAPCLDGPESLVRSQLIWPAGYRSA